MANRAQLVKRVAQKLGQGRRVARHAVDGTLDALAELLCETGRLELRDLGVFRVRRTAPRETVDPRTGEPITLPATNTVDFRPALKLKRELNPDQHQEERHDAG